jgi:hypothetical protein
MAFYQPKVPKRESRKNKSGIRGKFSKPEKRPPTHHNSPRFHHKLTIKTPRPSARFSQNPLQKWQNDSAKKILRNTRCFNLKWPAEAANNQSPSPMQQPLRARPLPGMGGPRSELQ